MIKFRWHRGLLDDSLKTQQTVESKDDIERLIRDEFTPFGIKEFNITYTYVGYDERCDWDTWYVSLNGMCVGMAELYKKKKASC